MAILTNTAMEEDLSLKWLLKKTFEMNEMLKLKSVKWLRDNSVLQAVVAVVVF